MALRSFLVRLAFRRQGRIGEDGSVHPARDLNVLSSGLKKSIWFMRWWKRDSIQNEINGGITFKKYVLLKQTDDTGPIEMSLERFHG